MSKTRGPFYVLKHSEKGFLLRGAPHVGILLHRRGGRVWSGVRKAGVIRNPQKILPKENRIRLFYSYDKIAVQ